MLRAYKLKQHFKKKLRNIQKDAIEKGLEKIYLERLFVCNFNNGKKQIFTYKKILVSVVVGLVSFIICVSVLNSVLSARCLLPSNYLVWEATRPLADCSYCANVTMPIILKDIGRRDFSTYAYSSKPIIVKNAIKHWKAREKFSFDFFKNLFVMITDSYESLEEGCQFLNFKSDLFTLKEVFNMPDARAKNEPGQEPWYVGWGNCHPDILKALRQYYDVPDFLPDDAELPANENIFFGYEIGAVMHLDYIPRIMWQGQIQGNKTWSIAPVTECEHVCHTIEYYVEPGDVGMLSNLHFTTETSHDNFRVPTGIPVLLDTRVWYHATRIPKGEFSLTVQSEYG